MVAIEHRLISLTEFLKMGESGIFHEDEHLELIDGEIIKMSPIGYRHAQVLSRLNKIITKNLNNNFIASPGNPVILQQKHYLEPDFCIFQEKENEPKGHPTEEEIELIIEISDSSLQYDQKSKLKIYAKSSIKEVWIINLIENQIEIYTQPQNDNYNKREIIKKGVIQKIQLTIEIDVDLIIK